MKLALPLALLFVVFLASSVAAQDVTGDIEGMILDAETHEPIVYANVIVTGPNLQGVRGTVSLADGTFVLLALPVGSYEVTVQHIGYRELTIQNVVVELGRTRSIGRFALEPTAIEMEAVVVSGRHPILDLASTGLEDNLSAEQLDKLPAPRDYREVIAYLPQANTSYRGDGINLGGATGIENQYFVEGVNVTDPFDGTNGTRLPQNFIREIQVKRGGYEARYGKALGGIVNVVTHTGTNELRGEVFGYFTGDDFAGGSRFGHADLLQDSFARWDIGASVGGPLVADQLWFFAAYAPTVASESLTIPGLGSYDDESVAHLFATKLSWRVDEDTHLDFSLFGDPEKRDTVGGDLLITPLGTIANPDPLLSRRTTGAITATLAARRSFGDRVVLKGSLARVQARDKNEPLTDVGRSEPTYIDTFGDTLSGGMQNRTDHRSVSWEADASVVGFVGDHEIEVGLGYQIIVLDEQWLLQTPDGRDGIVWRWDEDLWVGTTLLNDFEVSHRLPTVYAQDSWRVTDRLRLNLGLRWDGIYIANPEGDVVQSLNDGYQPRAGLSYQLDDRGRRRVSATYGRFVEQIPMVTATFYFGDFFQTLDAYDVNPIENPGATPLSETVYGIAGSDPLQAPYVDEFTLGYEQRVGESLVLGLHGIHRELGRTIQDVFLPPSFIEEQWLGIPGEGTLSYLPEAKRRYRALELSVQSELGRRLQVSAAYVLSESYGNYPGTYDTDGGNPNAHVSSAFWDPLQISDGKLPNDRPHVFKAYGSYEFDFGLTWGTYFTWQSGTPLSEYGPTRPGPYAYSHLIPRGTGGRTPSIWDWNLRFAYDLSRLTGPGAHIRSRLLVDVFHVFSQREPVNIDQIHFLVFDRDGNVAGENPNYLEPLAYQPPMTLRVGIETEF